MRTVGRRNTSGIKIICKAVQEILKDELGDGKKRKENEQKKGRDEKKVENWLLLV